MKIYLLFPLAILVNLPDWNNEIEKVGVGPEISTALSEKEISSKDLVGQWKRTASGPDDNKNRILDESEKMKPLEPGAHDNLHFYADGKCKVFGLTLELEGTWLIKNYHGKRTIFFTQKTLQIFPRIKETVQQPDSRSFPLKEINLL